MDVDTAALSVGVAPIDLHDELRVDEGLREAVATARREVARKAQAQAGAWAAEGPR